MTLTRPKATQIKFRSARTGNHILDTYLEACEKGDTTLPALLDQLYTEDGLINPDAIEFRVNASNILQARIGAFLDPAVPWVDVQPFFRQRGAHTNAAVYALMDVVTNGDDTYVCTVAHTATATINLANFAPVINGNIITTRRNEAEAARDAAAVSASNANNDSIATAADRVQTGLDLVATDADTIATAADRVQTGLDRIATNADSIATAADRVQTGLDLVATDADTIATAADRVQTGLDRTKASEWAENAEDVAVEAGQFSAKHHAIKAAASATLASDPIAPHVAEADPHAQYLLETDAAVTNSREWTADTVAQAEAEAGSATTRRAWTAQRVRQAIASWWGTISSTIMFNNAAQRITKDEHLSGANLHHLELYSPDLGGAGEISLRFHQANQWYGQLRHRSNGFHFTDGASNTYKNIFFGTATGALTGNAATATALATTRAINGTNFNGSAAITTANWGTSRNISIGGTAKAVNGSAAVTWLTSELAAQTAVTLATARAINGTNFNGSAAITTANWGTSRNISIGGTSKAVNGSANVTWTTVEIVPTSTNLRVNSLGVNTAGSGTAGEIRATNNITAYYSDDRLKTRLGYIEHAVEMAKTLDAFFYEPNQTAQDFGYKVERNVGLSAQQVQAILPEAVKPAPIDDKYLTIQYEKLVPLLVAAIKELTARIEHLEGR